MTFAHPQLLWFLLLPAGILLAAFLLRARATSTAHPKIPRAQLGSDHWSQVIGHWSFSPRPVAAILALACLVAAFARPQGATLAATPSFTQARDVLVAVDVSRSMLAEDVSPSRLARAQLLIRNLADELKGERLGLMPFAGTAFLQSPLSGDYEIFRTFLDELGPDMIPAGGSNFAALLQTADSAFGPPDTDAAVRPDRYLIVLSDGEAQDETWRPLAQKLSDRGVRVLALGLGTAEGAMVPDGQGALVKDERGAVVLSRLNPATLQSLARATDGTYLDASTWVDVPALLRDTIARGRTARAATDTAPRRQEFFIWVLAPALVLLAFALVREFPATPPRVSNRPLRATPPPLPVVRLVPLALAVYAVSLAVHPAFAASSAPSPAAEAAPPDPLVTLVGRLAASADLPPSDLARLADLTATRGEAARSPAHGSTPSSPGPAIPASAIQDALAAVALGQTAAPSAADWPALRSRLEALLAPPPQPPKSDQSNSDQSKKKSDESEKSDSSQNQKSDSSSSQSSPEQSSDSAKSQSSPSSGDSASDPSESSESSPSNPSDSTTQKTTGEKPLGDLASPKPDEPTPAANAPEKDPSTGDKSADPKPVPSPSDLPPDSPDTPTQTVGGVSASGRPEDPSANTSAALDPSLIVPQQRLERVRESDAPARLFQLLQDSEQPPDAAERRAAGNKHDW